MNQFNWELKVASIWQIIKIQITLLTCIDVCRIKELIFRAIQWSVEFMTCISSVGIIGQMCLPIRAENVEIIVPWSLWALSSHWFGEKNNIWACQSRLTLQGSSL